MDAIAVATLRAKLIDFKTELKEVRVWNNPEYVMGHRLGELHKALIGSVDSSFYKFDECNPMYKEYLSIMIDVFKKHDAEVSHDNLGWYTIHYAAIMSINEYFEPVILKHLGDDINKPTETEGLTALHIAIMLKDPVLVSKIIDRGGDPELETRNGFCPLDLSFMMKNDIVSKIVIRAVSKRIHSGTNIVPTIIGREIGSRIRYVPPLSIICKESFIDPDNE